MEILNGFDGFKFLLRGLCGNNMFKGYIHVKKKNRLLNFAQNKFCFMNTANISVYGNIAVYITYNCLK